MKLTRKHIKTLGIVGAMAAVTLASGETFAQVDTTFNAQRVVDILVSVFDSPAGKAAIVVGSIAGLVAYLFTQKVWTLIIVAGLIAAPFASDFIANIVTDSFDVTTRDGDI